MPRALANLQAAVALLEGLIRHGLSDLVLCPGSRSGPLAHAVGGLQRAGLIRLISAIDERSAAFHALGLAASSGRASAVITTSGTAVANLLPAAVEADRSCLPLLLLTADRPLRLKHCGANQTVNQEIFLAPACRWRGSADQAGLDRMLPVAINDMAAQAWREAHHWPGPVHLNLPLEEPLHPSVEEQERFWSGWSAPTTAPTTDVDSGFLQGPIEAPPWEARFALDPDRPGLVVAGPWRGHPLLRAAHEQALLAWQSRSGWPVLVDPLAAVPPELPGQIRAWDVLLPDGLPWPAELSAADLQVLRLGPMPASRRLERWLQALTGAQVLVSEGDQRGLDPLRKASQWSAGLATWWQRQQDQDASIPAGAEPVGLGLCRLWQQRDQQARRSLERLLPLQGAITEPALMQALPSLLPDPCTVMLAASSPVRDWQAFAPAVGAGIRCFSFRGASGIDGTLSLALGLARARGRTLLVTGDIALLHDSNGWLLADADGPPLLVLLIDNAGGGIFEQLPVPTAPREAFEQLFAMPQAVDPLALAAAHGHPVRQLACLEDLPEALAWGWAQARPALLRVCTDREADARLRQELRRTVQASDAGG